MVFALLAAAPAALGAWSKPVNVTRTPSSISWGPEVSVAHTGRAALMWTAETDSPTTPPVFTALRGVSGGFATPAAIPKSTRSTGLYPAIAVTDAGRALAVWQEFDGTRGPEKEAVLAAKGSLRTPGGRFGPGVTLARSTSFNAFQVGFTAAGAPFAVNGSYHTLTAGRWPPSGPLRVVSPVTIPGILLAVGANTDTALDVGTYTRTRKTLIVQRRSRSGVLGPRSRTLATYPCNNNPEEPTCDFPGAGIGLDRTGRGLVVWATRGKGRVVVWVANLYASGVVGAGCVLTRLGAHATVLDLKMNARGDAVLVVGDGGRLRAATRQNGRRFGAFQTLPARLGSPGGFQHFAIGPLGDVAITSFAADGDVLATVRERGHSFGPVRAIGNTNPPLRNTNGTISAQTEPAGIDARGRVTVTWLRGVSRANGAPGRVQVATYTP